MVEGDPERTKLEQLRAAVRRAWHGWARGVYLSFVHVPVFLFGLIGLYYTYWVFARLNQDTTTITNVAFGFGATLSALSFSCSRAIEGPTDDKDRFAYAGERFLHSAQMVLTASVLKYASVLLGVHEVESERPSFALAGHSIAGILVGVLFFYAFTSAHGGMIVLNRLLWRRLNRYPTGTTSSDCTHSKLLRMAIAIRCFVGVTTDCTRRVKARE